VMRFIDRNLLGRVDQAADREDQVGELEQP
jgi:hypothetical protein